MPADNPIFESAKQRSLRIALDYYRWRDPILRTKAIISWTVLLLAVLYVGWLLVDSAAGRRHASPGRVATVHATWDHQCAECHRDFRPLQADSVDFVSLLRGAAAPREALDEACLKCHAGPVHHANAKPDKVANCAACHRDHQGRNASIIRPADSQCTSCHAQIESHRTNPGYSPPIATVSAFGPAAASGDAPHPPFRSLANDPGQIKFNHWLHMQPGIAVADSRKRMLLTDMDAELRPQYAAFAGKDGAIQLTCAACHQAENADGAPSSGDYMQPIAFERHCRACHPLKLKSGTDEKSPLTVPHGLTADRVATVLDGLILGAEKAQLPLSPPTADESGALPLVPGKTLGQNLAQKIGADVLRRREKIAEAIRLQCDQCHYVQAKVAAGPNDLPDLAPSGIPAVWLTHARFDHRAHRHVECRTCHSAAYVFEERDKPRLLPHDGVRLAADQMPARDDQEVMIANLESCVTCHAPLRSGAGGARHDCAECHLYHGRDHVAPAVKSPAQSSRTAAGPVLTRTFFTSALQPAKGESARHANRIGVSSCTATNCHGDATPGASTWRYAFATWLASDPHAQAYDVLWTFRAREMTRLLSPPSGMESDRQPLSDAVHFQVLEQSCVGCHATPLADREAASHSDYPLGVHCESCHGAAGQWLHAHYRQGFSRAATAGFIDTKDLAARAEVCLDCHVGPNSATIGRPQVVDHDLIAAGHPRLDFEFHAYITSLPAHWDTSRDEQSQTGAYHFRSWLAGRLKQAEQAAALANYYQKNAQPPRVDFAQLDCAACHHQLAPGSWHQSPARPGIRPGQPPAAISLYSPKNADWSLVTPHRLRLAETLISRLAESDRPSWDSSVQAYLAVRAVAADISPQSYPSAAAQIDALHAALQQLGRYLGQDCFVTAGQRHVPTPYDSPTNFQPRALAPHTQPVLEALRKLGSAVSLASPP